MESEKSNFFKIQIYKIYLQYIFLCKSFRKVASFQVCTSERSRYINKALNAS